MRKRCNFLRGMLILVFALVIVLAPMGHSMSQAKEPIILKNWVPTWPDCVEIWRILSKDLEKLETGGVYHG